jgi:hypothetical protein
MLTGVVEPKLTVGGYWAPDGLEVTEAVKATLPVKPPAGVTVIVEVLAVVAPGAMVTGVPMTLKVGFTPVVTEMVALPVLVLWLGSPE